MVNAHLEPGYGDFIASKRDPPPPSTPSLNVSNLFINAPPHQKVPKSTQKYIQQELNDLDKKSQSVKEVKDELKVEQERVENMIDKISNIKPKITVTSTPNAIAIGKGKFKILPETTVP